MLRFAGRLKPKNDMTVSVALAPISLCSVRVREDVDAEMEKSGTIRVKTKPRRRPLPVAATAMLNVPPGVFGATETIIVEKNVEFGNSENVDGLTFTVMPGGRGVTEKDTVPLSPLIEDVVIVEVAEKPWPMDIVENARGENTEKSWVRTRIATEW